MGDKRIFKKIEESSCDLTNMNNLVKCLENRGYKNLDI